MVSVDWMRRAGAWLTTLVVVAVLAGLVGFGALTRPEATERTAGPGVEALLVTTDEIRWEAGYTVQRSFVGRVEARQESDIGFEVAGMVASVAVEEGELAATGTELARLDSERLRARRAELMAAEEQAEADRALAELTLKRIAEARELNAASAQDLDDAEKALASATANANRASAAVASIEVDIAKTTVRSPFDAVVARRFVDVGRVIDAGMPVVRLLERKHPEVRIGVGGAAVDAVSVGQHFDVRIRDRVVDGVVTSILPVRDRAGRGVDVVVRLDAEIDGIRSGDLARVTIGVERVERGFWLPMQALTEGTRGLWSVYVVDVVDGESMLRRADVEVLHQETDRVFARGALADDQRFVAAGLQRVSPGMRVRVMGGEGE